MYKRMLRIAPRFRRARFLVLALLVTFILVRWMQKSDWEVYSPARPFGFPSAKEESKDANSEQSTPGQAPVLEPLKNQPTQTQSILHDKERPTISTKAKDIAAAPTPPPSRTTPPSMPQVILPDRKILPPTNVHQEEVEDDIHPIGPPGRQEWPNVVPAPTTIHWVRQSENFPVPTESIIHLPTGAPATIPKIQHIFNDETPDAKINREKRQSKVKEEFKKAWTGYRNYAWLHDELSPVSGNFRDPFCGWAATLVDSLDTLWIMGLHEEFEEAARAVDKIDFTTSPRADIPMFETTIRYLGGLVAAYDVSSGKYKNLLNKAVELADIMMGAFDTPNRMPILYYHWKPGFASQPHRASQRSNTAELGSLSLEFTRLAQLTNEPRYYDAVARITNGLSDLQDRGTALPGVFPDNIDASGCNRTIPLSSHDPMSNSHPNLLTPSKLQHEAEGFKPNTVNTVPEPRPRKKGGVTGGPGTLEFQVIPGEVPKAQIVGFDKNSQNPRLVKRDEEGVMMPNRTSFSPPMDPVTGIAVDLPGAKAQMGQTLGDWDCVPQGLESSPSYGISKFSMGGGQDSTYEYFPKQYLLLGGREEKYKKMYLQTIDAVKKWMLYRPMVPTERSLLMSGSVTTRGDPDNDAHLNAEHEHLTCFIGGMVGMGAKIFNLEGDLELAQRLADGCVWSYEATGSGIMPESGVVLPCESVEHCPWNESVYRRYLDPMGSERDRLLVEYIANKSIREKEAEEEKLAAAEASRAKAEAEAAGSRFDDGGMAGGSLQHAAEGGQRDGNLQHVSEDHHGTSNKDEENQGSQNNSMLLQKRQMAPSGQEGFKPATHHFKDDVANARAKYEADRQQEQNGQLRGDSNPSGTISPQQKLYEEKIKTTEAELHDIASGRQAEVPLSESAFSPQQSEVLPDPMMPLSHQQYVDNRIKMENLPKGYVGVNSRKYILRPEAIESVFYMYRITGSPIWLDKGWKMFESVIKATATPYGHSAISDVTVPQPDQMDEMESFWLAETLKYFYLLYSTPDTVSLDEWVLNTEAHPFRREKV